MACEGGGIIAVSLATRGFVGTSLRTLFAKAWEGGGILLFPGRGKDEDEYINYKGVTRVSTWFG